MNNNPVTNQTFTGLIAAPHTPMHGDYRLNVDMINLQAHTLVTNGVKGVFVCGTTGEGMLLSEQERKLIGERWTQVAGDELHIIIHVGACSIDQAKRLAGHAENEINADAIATIGPVIFKQNSIAALVDYCEDIASAAPQTPFYYYHIPGFTGIDLPMIEFLDVGSKRIPSLAGIKYTGGDLYDFGLCLDYENGKYSILFGQDENLLAGLALGATGAVGSTYNFASPLYCRIMDSFRNGDVATARSLQAQSRKMVQIFHKYGVFAGLKATMKIIGIDCGPNRPPVTPLEGTALTGLTRDLDELGFFDFCSEVESEEKVVSH